MTVQTLAQLDPFTPLACPDPDREITGAYVGDLLSWVMGRAAADNAWITIMSNINIVAVASLSDVSCIVLAEGVAPDANVLDAANAKGINILQSSLAAYETAVLLHDNGV